MAGPVDEEVGDEVVTIREEVGALVGASVTGGALEGASVTGGVLVGASVTGLWIGLGLGDRGCRSTCRRTQEAWMHRRSR